MSRKYKFLNPDGIYFVTTATVNWVDVFTRIEYKEVLIDSLKHCIDHKGLRVHAWVIMTNHIHLIVSAEDSLTLATTFRDLKKFTAHTLLQLINDYPQESRKEWLMRMFAIEGKRQPDSRVNKFWQEGVHPKELDTPEKLQNTLDYIHQNPVKQGIVFEPWEYIYSSAVDYMTDGKGLLKLVLLA